MQPNTVQLLNVQLNNLTTIELLDQFTQGFLVTPNVDHLIKLQKDRAFFEAYESADFRVCDSRILFLLTRILFPGNTLKEQITGSDFFPTFCAHHANSGAAPSASVFLLGGSETSVVVAQEKINQRTQSQIVVGCYSPPFGFEKNAEENDKIIQMINESGADTLAIGVGAPKQEIWVYKNRNRFTHVKRFLAIGATIEFESGNLKRSPKWMTRCGIEWVYRLSQEPKRLFKRYILEDLPIFFHLLKQRLGLYKNPWQMNSPHEK